VNIAITINKQ